LYAQSILRDDLTKWAQEHNKRELIYDQKNLFKVASESPYITEDALVSRFQNNLEKSSRILMTHHDAAWLDYLELSGKALVHLPTVPLHWVINGVFDGEYNKLNLYSWYYKNGLERTYVFNPLDADQDDFLNDPLMDITGLNRLQAKDISFQQLRNVLDKAQYGVKRLPFPIINTSGWRGKKLDDLVYSDHKNTSTADRIFEFTPLRAGSTQFGFWPHEAFGNPDFSRVVSLSGAALDAQARKLNANGKPLRDRFGDVAVGWVTDSLNLDIGGYLPNPNTAVAHRLFHKLLPWPLWWLDDLSWSGSDSEHTSEREDRFSSKIYLNDGGKSENFGAFSLIRRGTETVVIIDAEADDRSEYEGLRHLAWAVKNELGLEFVDQKGHDFVPCKRDLPPPTGRPDVQHLAPDVAVMCARLQRRDGKEPVLVYRGGTIKVPEISLIYVKLAIHRPHLRRLYPTTVADYARKHLDFPHQSTVDVFYDADQYRAYRDLGATLGASLADVLEKQEVIISRRKGEFKPPECPADEKSPGQI
jgi:hypothetical protein